ncbi:MAG TPA: hypothetical protein VF669_11780 [Tepidisphaeraceae bacterium]
MAKNAIVFGVLMVLLGIGAFVGTGSTHKTALIPAYFGAAILLCGVIATKPAARMHAMHGAAMVATIGVIGSIVMVAKGITSAARSGALARPVAFWCQVIMLILCAVFVAMCIKSFRDARRNRVADAH